MTQITSEGLGTDSTKVNLAQTDYHKGIRQLLEKEVRDMAQEELRKGVQELMEEQRKAIKQLLEQNKAAIRQVAEEEKKAVWVDLDNIRKSIISTSL